MFIHPCFYAVVGDDRRRTAGTGYAYPKATGGIAHGRDETGPFKEDPTDANFGCATTAAAATTAATVAIAAANESDDYSGD